MRERAPLLTFAELELSTVDPIRRTIEGLAVVFGETATLADGHQYTFLPGSLTLGRQTTPLVLGHDENRPIGVLAGMDETEREWTARFTVDNTPDGDTALAQAASGSRPGLSVGVLIDRFVTLANGVREVAAARVFHVALCTVQAFERARVLRVAAELGAAAALPDEGAPPVLECPHCGQPLALVPEPPPEGETAMSPEPAPASAPTPAASSGPAIVHPIVPAPAAPAEIPVVLTHASRPATPAALPHTGGELVLAMLRSQTGDVAARQLVEAALSDVLTSDIPGLVPPTYTTEILGELPDNRPLATRVAVSRPMPASGMVITKPRWSTLPVGGWIAVEGADIASNTPAVDPEDTPIEEWAYGVSLSYAAATRSTPDALEAIYRAAVANYHNAVEVKLAAAIMAVDQAVAAGGVGAGIAAFFGDMKEPPNILLVSPDVYGEIVDEEGVMKWTSGSVAGAGLSGSIAGLEVVVSGHLPAATRIITQRGAIELRESDPVRLTANAIGALRVELGVTAFASFDVEKPEAFHNLTSPFALTPAAAKRAKSS